MIDSSINLDIRIQFETIKKKNEPIIFKNTDLYNKKKSIWIFADWSRLFSYNKIYNIKWTDKTLLEIYTILLYFILKDIKINISFFFFSIFLNGKMNKSY